MRIWRIREFGGPEQLELQQAPEPEPGRGEILVRVRAAGVNRADLLQRMGQYPPPPSLDPMAPGLEYAGEVVRCGGGAERYHAGERVMGLIGAGAYAEYVCVHEREAMPVPEGLEWHEAAALPEPFLTAYRALFLEGGLAPGGVCLIRAVTSGVGIAAVQLATALGACAMGTSRSAERLARVEPFGLARAIVEGRDDPVAAAREASRGEGADVVLDLLGGGYLTENLRALRDEGTAVLVGVMAGRSDELDMGRLLMRRLTLRAMTMRSQPLERRIAMAEHGRRRLLPLVVQGRLRPCVDQVVGFEEAPEAHRMMAAGEHLGRIVLELKAG